MNDEEINYFIKLARKIEKEAALFVNLDNVWNFGEGRIWEAFYEIGNFLENIFLENLPESNEQIDSAVHDGISNANKGLEEVKNAMEIIEKDIKRFQSEWDKVR